MRDGTYLHLYVDVGHNDHRYTAVDDRLLDMTPSIARQHSTEHRPLQIGDVISRVPSDEQAAVHILPLTLILIAQDILAGSPWVGTDAAIWMVLQKRVQLLAEPHRILRLVEMRVATEVEQDVLLDRFASDIRRDLNEASRLVDWQKDVLAGSEASF